MNVYDVLVQSLHHRLNKHSTQWVRGVRATCITEASAKALAMYPNLGVTPTTVSSIWAVWPQGAKQ